MTDHPTRGGKIKDWSSHVRRFRKRHGLTQKALALQLPCALRTIEHWEEGDREPAPYLKRALRDLEREITTSALASKSNAVPES